MEYNNYGYVRVSAAMPVVKVSDCQVNADNIIRMAKELSEKENPSVIAFPELGVTGYTCGDLFGNSKLILESENAVRKILDGTVSVDSILVFGVPVRHSGRLFNCAVVSRCGRILGLVPKTYLAGNAEFYEPRWFESARALSPKGAILSYAGQNGVLMSPFQIFCCGRLKFAVELCQDLWAPLPPSTFASLAGAQLIVNLSASNEILLKHEYRRSLVSATSSRLFNAYLYCSAGYGESTQDLVWAGASMIGEYGSILVENERFLSEDSSISADIDVERLDVLRSREYSYRADCPVPEFTEVDCGALVSTDFEAELKRYIEPHPFVPQGDEAALDSRCSEIISAQVAGLQTRLEHIRCRKAVIGVSGGLDSTLALLVTALAFDRLGIPRSNIIGVTMPGFGTTERTYNNSKALMDLMGITSEEISIVKATRQHFSDIGQDESVHDLTYENSQARERTQILMDLAGKHGGKASEVLLDIADTPISPELIPSDENGQIKQKTEDLVGPYELHDFFLYSFFRCGFTPEKILFLAGKAYGDVYDKKTLHHWLQTFLKRFFTQQFKRSCIPDGPKVGSVSLSPRGDWRMPSDIACPWEI